MPNLIETKTSKYQCRVTHVFVCKFFKPLNSMVLIENDIFSFSIAIDVVHFNKSTQNSMFFVRTRRQCYEKELAFRIYSKHYSNTYKKLKITDTK